MYDLIVIGGGPAGTSAAITAARAGARVLLLERGRFPRHKVCGEFVSAESLDLLGRLLDSGGRNLLNDAVRIAHARIFLDGHTLRTVADPPAASIARLELDEALWNSAIECGVDARQQTVVQGINGTGPFQVKTADGEFEAQAVINASGRWSNLTAQAGNGGSEKWVGLKGHFAESPAEISVDLYFFEGGYCGVQPVDLNAGDSKSGRVNACAMVRADVASSLPEVFARYPALLERSRRWEPLSDPVTTSPLIFRQPQPERAGVLMVGDAAAFVDPFVGDGVSLALRGGSLAAEHLVPFFKKEISLPDAVAAYRRQYQASLAPVFRASSGIRRLLGLPRPVRRPLLYLFGKTPALLRYLGRKTRWIAETELADQDRFIGGGRFSYRRG
ncbi:MAG: FAD-dependent oxidoreductase [Terriglobales bacterium]|jgi:flavin-dependent dehydrogenase